MLAVHGSRGAQGGLFRLGDLHGLSLIVDIRVGGDFHAVLIQSFKDHGGSASKKAGVQRVGKFHSAICGFGSEFHLCGDFSAIHQERFTSALVHKDTGNGVGFAGGQSSILHHIHNGDFPCGISDVAAVHGSGGAQGGFLRFGNLHGLVFIVDIRVGGNLHIGLI